MYLCLYVPVSNVDHNDFEYFESNGLPHGIKSVLKLSLFLPSHELMTYRTWKKVMTENVLILMLLFTFNIFKLLAELGAQLTLFLCCVDDLFQSLIVFVK